ncbi:MAG: DnaJ domain-containing protein [Spirochaetaceae bacterium]|nr:DnaJ domain-containing protein [Spirochaetaceae bacterium]
MNLFDEVKKSHYEALGVAKTAEEGEIKRAYFSLVRKYQPDRFPEEFKEIRAAYETLMDREKRAEYDATGDLPASVIPLYREAQWLDRYGKHGKAAEFYQMILKSHPELDTVREQYGLSLSEDGKNGKAAEVWEYLCRKHPDNPYYARELGQSYCDRGWNRKALAETRRALALDRSSIDSWTLLITCTIAGLKNSHDTWDELKDICREALEAVKPVKTKEWEKIHLYVHALITTGIAEPDLVRDYLREIVRLVRESGRDGLDEGQEGLNEILLFIPAEGLGFLYPDLKELADLLPDTNDKKTQRRLEDIRLNFEIEGLTEKGFHEMFRDLFRIVNADIEEEHDAIELASIEYIILDNKTQYDPQLRRLKEEFPELYALHSSFFNEALRTRDPEKMLYQRGKMINKFKREAGLIDEESEPVPETIRRTQPKVGRNDPCPCGSGKKYKRCCGA